MEMAKIDFKKYYDIDMNYLTLGPKGYMIEKERLKEIISNELKMSFDKIIDYCNSIFIKTIESEVDEEFASVDKMAIIYDKNLLDIITTEEEKDSVRVSKQISVLNYIDECINIYKSRINKFKELIDAIDKYDEEASKELLNKYDIFVSADGIYYKDLERIINAFTYNVVELYIMDKYINKLVLYKSKSISLDYPSTSIQVNSIGDKRDMGVMPLTENQERKRYSDYTSKHLSIVKKIK